MTEFSADAWQASAPGLRQGLAERMDALDRLTQGLQALAGSRNISGEGADAMRAYIREVHVPVLQCLLLGLSTFQTAVGVYWAGYRHVEAHGNFHLVRDEHQAHLTQLDAGMQQLRGVSAQLRQISADASHLVSLGSAGAGAADRAVDEVQRMHLIVKTQLESWEAYEASDPGFRRVQELISRLRGIVNRVGSANVGRGRSYVPGSFQGELAPLGELTAEMSEYCRDNQDLAAQGWQDMFDQYAKDVRAAEDARREQAGWDLIWDAVQIATGAVVTAIGLGLTPFTGGTSLFLTGLGAALVVGGINSAINHTSIWTTGNDLDLADMACQWWDASVARPVAAWGGDWEAIGGFLSGAGHAVTSMAQLNVHQVGMGITAFATDQAARDALWQEVSGFAGRVANGDKFAAGQALGEVAGLLIPGAAAGKAARASGLLNKAGRAAEGLVRQPKLPATNGLPPISQRSVSVAGAKSSLTAQRR
ncbi:T7SS effector LXG polymorphic toxin [Leifsonia poae]|uniref:T7SS effector LXG polymorphic toxin n=1 Tax=Leifsonia poae TaxID=110933 RepID=UPI003D684ED8